MSMIELQNAQHPDVLELKVIGKLSKADLEHLSPVLEKQIAESGEPRLLIIMEQFKGWDDAAAFWKDLQLDTQYIGKFDRIALVGDAKWEEWLTKLGSPVVPTDLKYFNLPDITHAHKWLDE